MLELEGVTKTFGGVVANDAISLTVEEGAIVGLIGPNGSGKTTLFNAITGVLPIDAGAIRFKGREISALLAGDIARAGIIRTFQQPRIYARDDGARQHARLGLGARHAFRPSVLVLVTEYSRSGSISS